jgi:CBS domain-containing membrane protein
LEARLVRLTSTLAGERPRDILLAGIGAFFGIALVGLLSTMGVAGVHAPLLVAPIGASAVLVFAVPSSPLAQPWSVVGGNVLSCLVALAVCQAIANPVLASGVAVGCAIVLMSGFRCLHPPGGAVALLTALAARHANPPDLLFAFSPVGVNSVLLVMIGLIFHRLSGHSYPHIPAAAPKLVPGVADAPPSRRAGFLVADFDAVLAEMHEAFDISRGDLEELVWRLEDRILARTPGSPSCADIMSKDVITIPFDATVADAREQMLARRLRCMPVVNRVGAYVGMVEARHLIGDQAMVAAVMTAALVAWPETLALTFAPALSGGGAYEVVVVDPDYRVLGLITQTDMLAAALRALHRRD